MQASEGVAAVRNRPRDAAADNGRDGGATNLNLMRLSTHSGIVFAIIFVVIFLLHAPLLRLPYFWDEAGYYVPAARDLLLTASLIPHTTVSNAHPPLVMAWIALWWKVVGFTPIVTRSAMLFVAAFSLLGVFRLAQQVAGTAVAVAATACTAVYPVFFAQSSLAQVDLAAAGFTFWGLTAFLNRRLPATGFWFSLAVLAKETAVVGILGLVLLELVAHLLRRNTRWKQWYEGGESRRPGVWTLVALFVSVLVLATWYSFHYLRTGYVFGNPEFFRYNVASTMNPLRFLIALILRLWQAFGYLHLWALTLGMILAMSFPALQDSGKERRRIPIPVQLSFLAIVSAYVIAMALIGGAVLARYMLPTVPLVIVLAVSTLRRRFRQWVAAVAIVIAAFVLGWFWNPPYGFSPEDNLAYRDYVVLHEQGERYLEARYPMAQVLTAWPGSDELTRPWLGYTTRPMQVVRVEDFSLEQVLSAAEFRDHYRVALVFSTKYEPPNPWLDRWRTWTDLKRRFFGFHRDLPPVMAAKILGGQVVFTQERKGQWIAVIETEPSEWRNAEIMPSLGLFPVTNN